VEEDAMKSVNFRDAVLWPLAHKMGIDPDITRNGQGIMPDQADAWVSFINEWVRRLWTAQDWPEWTRIAQYVVPGSNVIPWGEIRRPLAVYLVDPRTVNAPVDVPVRFDENGIFVGGVGGASVWIKYVPDAPVFTAREWSPSTVYMKGDLAYSPVSGECYVSNADGNVGHDPTITFSSLPSTILSQALPRSPGVAATPRVVQVTLLMGAGDVNGSVSTWQVVDNTTGAVLATATHTGAAGQLPADVLTDLYGQLNAALTGFVLTLDTTNLRITIQGPVDFSLSKYFWTPSASSKKVWNRLVELAAYKAAIPGTDTATPQVASVAVGSDQVVPGATYTLTLSGSDAVDHSVSYVSAQDDGPMEILQGLSDSIKASSDTWFSNHVVGLSLDGTNQQLLVTTLSPVSLRPIVIPPVPVQRQWWNPVLFPAALVEPVLRGAYADALRAEGQTGKGAAEEQATATEAGVLAGSYDGVLLGGLTDSSSSPRWRYSPWR
jgi:hypothetical protein